LKQKGIAVVNNFSISNYKTSKYSSKNNIFNNQPVNDEYNYPVKLKHNDVYTPIIDHSQKQTIDNLKEIINKIDNKIGYSPNEDRSSLSFSTNKH
jgi:hypothetical protein